MGLLNILHNIESLSNRYLP